MLCADLVDIQWKDPNGRSRRGVANLEDISLSGACLQVDRPVPLGTALHISYPNGELTRKSEILCFSRNRLFPGDRIQRWLPLVSAQFPSAASAGPAPPGNAQRESDQGRKRNLSPSIH